MPTDSLSALRSPPTGPARATPHGGPTRIELHAPDPVCRVAPDWRIGLVDGLWTATDVSGRWPRREPWWSVPRTPEPSLGGVIHLLICCIEPGDLPPGPAEVAGLLVAELMESYAASNPAPHYARGRIATPKIDLARASAPPLDCPPWSWGEAAEGVRFEASQRIRAPLTERLARRLWGE